jgi:hypothetical protein
LLSVEIGKAVNEVHPEEMEYVFDAITYFHIRRSGKIAGIQGCLSFGCNGRD